ncbi:MAG: glycoside hydrolase family 2 TIM barrel-domain containing protein [Verrucomicrobiota bacterium]
MNPIFAAAFLCLLINPLPGAPVRVSLKPGPGEGRSLIRDGKPYFVKGAGGTTRLADLAARGANSLRTWSTEDLGRILDEAASLHLTVSAGIWLEPECDWFSYRKPEDCAKQAERVLNEVLKFRNHPALLAWGLGNEAEGDGANADFWKQLDRLAVRAKEADPEHPVFTAVAGMNRAKAQGMNEHTPHLDFVGINTYGGIFSLRKSLPEMGWTRPWLLTEWGPQGFWERPKRPWGAALEQTGTEKAGMMDRAYKEVIAPGGDCLGSYAFIWGWKLEGSATWFSLLTDTGETTASVDVLGRHWSGSPPVNTAPDTGDLQNVPAAEIVPRATFTATLSARDAENDPLTWRWAVLPEPGNHDAGRPQPMPAAVPGTVGSPASPEKVTVTAPEQPGYYRLHVWITDGKGHTGTASAPFAVK